MTIEDAIAFAAMLHKGQKDKAGMPYIWHPLRIAMRLRTEEQQMVAVLHDVIEDTGLQRRVLERAGVPRRILDALTRRKGEPGLAPAG